MNEKLTKKASLFGHHALLDTFKKTVDGEELEFSDGFTDLHTEVYRQILAGNGHGIDVARPSIQLTHQIRTAPITEPGDLGHPFLTKLRG